MGNVNRRDFLKMGGIGAAGVLASSLSFSKTAQKNEKPNIVLIMADDLGYECLSCYGGQSYQTPELDNLARSGVRFEYCYSQPLCTPSRVQIMTGRYNFRNYKMFGYLELNETTFGHVLQREGYKTCIAGKWQLGSGIEGPHYAGYDDYCLWQIYNHIAGKDHRGPRYADPKLYRNGKVLEGLEGEYGPDVNCDFVMNFMEENRSRPFFVYYPMILTHDPFKPTPGTEAWDSDRHKKDPKYFADMVRHMDRIVGRIVRKLDDLGLRDNTLILFTGDNGSPRQIRSRFRDGWVQGGKSFVTESGTHVPLITSWRGKISSDQVCEDLVDFTDFFPTLAEASGASLPEKIQFDGRSFFPQLMGQKGNPREWVFIHYWGRGRDPLKTKRCVLTKEWKLYEDGRFYNIHTDPLEQNALSPDNMSGEARMAKSRLRPVFDRMK